MRVRRTIIYLTPRKSSCAMCVIYCSACATLRDLEVSEAQQTVTDAIIDMNI